MYKMGWARLTVFYFLALRTLDGTTPDRVRDKRQYGDIRKVCDLDCSIQETGSPMLRELHAKPVNG